WLAAMSADAGTGAGRGGDAVHRAPAEGTTPVPEPPQPWAGLLRLLDDGELAAAAWVARCLDPYWGSAVEALAIAAALCGDPGPLSEALWVCTHDWATHDWATPDRATQDRATHDWATPDRATPDRAELPDAAASQVLTGALCVAATISPFTG